MDERLTRLWAGAETEAIGAGGITLVAMATGMSRTTIRAGRDELRKGVAAREVVKVRRAGAGRSSIEERKPEIIDAMDHLVDPPRAAGPALPHRGRGDPALWCFGSPRSQRSAPWCFGSPRSQRSLCVAFRLVESW